MSTFIPTSGHTMNPSEFDTFFTAIFHLIRTKINKKRSSFAVLNKYYTKVDTSYLSNLLIAFECFPYFLFAMNSFEQFASFSPVCLSYVGSRNKLVA